MDKFKLFMILYDAFAAFAIACLFKMAYGAADPFQMAVIFFLALITMRIGDSK